MKILNQGFDHVEWVVASLSQHAKMYETLGFEKIGERSQPKKGLKSAVYAQGLVRVLVTEPDLDHPTSASQFQTQFLKKHGDGLCTLAVEVEDARQAYQETTQAGAKSAREPEVFESAQGSLVRSEIYTPDDLRYAFIQRKGSSSKKDAALFDQDLIVSRLESPNPMGVQKIDHLTNNVSMGEMPKWVQYYKDIFGFTVTRHFHIKTGRTGLNSDVVQSADHKIKVPINEATEPESQIQEFVTRFKGPGVQHLALLTDDILKTVPSLRARGIKFLSVPHAYYEAVPVRVPGVTENLQTLEEHGILLDGEGGGYLLQIFSQELVGPFFLEFIQRKGNEGFGEGNFRALFEAIERDQIKRGVL